MLITRLWMGAVLIVLTLGMLAVDPFLAPWFPFLFVFQMGLSLVGCFEFIRLLGPHRSPQKIICYLGVILLVFTLWFAHSPLCTMDTWSMLAGIQAGFLLLIFIYEMAFFTDPGRSMERMALTWLILGYLGLLPCFFAQLRWISSDEQANSVSLALAAFVPKCCDIGAYATGRTFGRHRMAPVLSPQKTWEGACGGLLAGILSTVAIDRLGPVPVFHHYLGREIGFGFTVGLAGMLGDLAESLIKRDCHTKDASTAVPGFGGVLDVVDAIVYAAPVSYLWFYLLKWHE